MENSNKERFIQASIKYGLASEEGNSRVANKNVEIIKNVKEVWKKDRDVYISEMLSLIEHPEDYVKLKAAYSLIPYCPKEARQVLDQLSSQKRGQLGFEAERILFMWDSGELKI